MKLLLYCTKAKPYLYGMYSGFESKYGYHTTNDKNISKEHTVLNGKIVAECDYDIEEITDDRLARAISDEMHFLERDNLLKGSCLNGEEIKKYFTFYDWEFGEFGKVIGYAIHIKNLHIFDKPYEFGKALIYNFNTQYIVEKAPQNMMKVYNRAGECHILISIKPEWLCKILNGEKIIEVRKKVLKEMK